MYNLKEKHSLNILDLLTDIQEIEMIEYRLFSDNGKNPKNISK